jgi:ketosteroid isomerase-like protein
VSTEDEVRQVSDQFYAALNRMLNGDAGPVLEVWSHSSDVTTMHPVGGRQIGWEEVRASWEQFAQLSSSAQANIRDRLIRVVGDLAYELVTEYGEGTVAGQPVSYNHRATNVYRREAGAWKMVHHHTDIAPVLQEILRSLQASQVEA